MFLHTYINILIIELKKLLVMLFQELIEIWVLYKIISNDTITKLLNQLKKNKKIFKPFL